MPATARVASEADRERIRDVVRDVVYPADAAFLEALRGDYLAAIARGARALVGARTATRSTARRSCAWTTLEVDPREVHQIGLEELETIEAERRAIARGAGFGDDTRAYRARLAADPANSPRPGRSCSTAPARTSSGRWPSRRGTSAALPRSACEVRPVEEFKERDAPFAYYYPPSTDGDPARHLLREHATTCRRATYSQARHDDVPRGGPRPPLPDRARDGEPGPQRRSGASARGCVGGAYVEGWGLYAERLADEMGLYRNEAERFGMLDAQAWRAARLVVDTGMHALRWTRQQSIDTLLARRPVADGRDDRDRPLHRWPGQALTYKLGQREIERLRGEIAARDGARFDLREFHDRCSATARCRSRRSPASCRTG